jgi:hypothetical protein
MNRSPRPNRYDRFCLAIDAYFQPRVQAAYDYAWNRWGIYLGTVKLANVGVQVLLAGAFVWFLEFVNPYVKLGMLVIMLGVLLWTLQGEGRTYARDERRFQREGDYERLNRVVDHLVPGVIGWHGFAPTTVATVLMLFIIQQWKSALAYLALISIMSLLGYLRRVYVHARDPDYASASA